MRKSNKNIYKSLKIEKLNPLKPINPINKLQVTGKLSKPMIRTGNSRTPLSEFLNAYTNLIGGLKSNVIKGTLHQIELEKFEIETNTGMAGFQDQQLNLKI